LATAKSSGKAEDVNGRKHGAPAEKDGHTLRAMLKYFESLLPFPVPSIAS